MLQRICVAGRVLPSVGDGLGALAHDPAFQIPFPGEGATLKRWQVLSQIASHDLSLVKLFEGHADALAIRHELAAPLSTAPDALWAIWASESPNGRVLISAGTDEPGATVRVSGRKLWCSGAREVTHALITAWRRDGGGPLLVAIDLAQAGVMVDEAGWQAIGMADSGSFDVHFEGATGHIIGRSGDYVARRGFMQGGAGIAACWYGGATAIAAVLRHAVAGTPAGSFPFRRVALGRVDVALKHTAALLREAADWIDAHPRADASIQALRVRQCADACATLVLDEVGRALGATPFCRDPAFARMAVDLPVFVRQNLAERDLLVLGERVAADPESSWSL